MSFQILLLDLRSTPMRILVYLLLAGLFLQSCKKDELTTVTGNKAPPDPTVASVTVENYITRTYILVLGREPNDVELSSAKSQLVAADLDSSSRYQFLNQVFAKPEYLPHVYEQYRVDMLNNTDTTEFTNWITIFQFFLLDSTYQYLWPTLQFEIARLDSMRQAFNEFTHGTIPLSELHRRICNNYIYDQINMGSANFVLSTFQHLLNRNPTNAEQISGISMVEGSNANLFLQSGNSKPDYLAILTGNNNYYEAQLVLLYQRYLHRNPTTLEMDAGTLKYPLVNGVINVQEDILSTNEFIGL